MRDVLFGVGDIFPALVAPVRRGARAETDAIFAAPVADVVTAPARGSREVGDFVLMVAGGFQNVPRPFVHLDFLLLAGNEHAFLKELPERRARSQRGAGSRDVQTD